MVPQNLKKISLFMALLTLLVLSMSVVSADTNISACGTYATGNYQLNTSIIASSATCLVFNETATLDCKGYWINQSTSTHNRPGISLTGSNLTFRNCNVQNYSVSSTGTGRVIGYNSTFRGIATWALSNTPQGHYFEEVTFKESPSHFAGHTLGNNAVLNKCTIKNYIKPFGSGQNFYNINLTINNSNIINLGHSIWLANGTRILNTNFSNSTFASPLRFNMSTKNVLFDNCKFTNLAVATKIMYYTPVFSSASFRNITIQNSEFNSHKTYFAPGTKLISYYERNNMINYTANTDSHFLVENASYIGNIFTGNNLLGASVSARKTNLLLEDNTFDNFDGFFMRFNRGLVKNNIFNNTIFNFISSNHTTVEGNTFYNSGINAYEYSIYGVGTNITFDNNTFYNLNNNTVFSGGYGAGNASAIRIQNFNNVTIVNNNCLNVHRDCVAVGLVDTIVISDNIADNSAGAIGKLGFSIGSTSTNILFVDNKAYNFLDPLKITSALTDSNVFANSIIEGYNLSVSTGSDNHTFQNISVGVDYFSLINSDDNYLNDMTVVGDFLIITTSDGNTIVNSSITGDLNVTGNSVRNVLINTSVSGNINVADTSNLTIKWYLTLTGTADFKLYDNQSNLILSGNYAGNTSTHLLDEANIIGAATTNYSPYTLYRYDGIHNISAKINLTESKTVILTPHYVSPENICTQIEGKYWYLNACHDNPQTEASQSAEGVKTIVFLAFGLLALLCLVSATYLMIQIIQSGSMDSSEIMLLIIAIIGLGIVLFIGYYLIGLLSTYL